MTSSIVNELKNRLSPKTRLFTAGPVACFPEILEVMSLQMFSHRSKEYKWLHSDTINRLKSFLGCQDGEVLLFPSSGTGLMEASIRNAISPRGKVLVTIIGAFGKRYSTVIKENGRDSVELSFELGESVNPKILDEFLRQHEDVEAVTITYNETTTGVLNNLPELAHVVKSHDKLLFVDAVSAMGAADIQVDKWEIDLIFSSSQKAFGVPPGLAIGAFSQKMLQLAENAENPGWYFNLSRYVKVQEKKQGTPSTPPIPQIVGINAALRLVDEQGGKEKWYEMYERRARKIREGVYKIGLDVLAEKGRESPTITAVRAPNGVKGTTIYEEMRKRGFELAKGYGSLVETTFRIGHMGYITNEDIEDMLTSLESLITSLS